MKLLAALGGWTPYHIATAAAISISLLLIVFLSRSSFYLIPLPSFQIEQSESEELRNCHGYSANDSECPSYFAWIHEDLSAWNASGITQSSMEAARAKADYHVVVVDGKLYAEIYNKCFQTRDNYTLWGMLMLLETYPGQVPDLEIYGTCGDAPQVHREDYSDKNWPPPPLFVYCTTRVASFYDIVIPDWSFWGWPEVNIRPWVQERESIFQASSEKPWLDREPFAFWKGNKWMSQVRKDLIACNGSQFDALVYHQDWWIEAENGFPTSNLSRQCFTRYKVYAEGGTWSVGLKYATACGSTLLQIDPIYGEFFARSWIPYVHYWPVSRGSNLCNSLKHGVEYGNAHPGQAEAVAKCGRSFMENHLTMKHVYQYMLHLLQAYAKLQRFKPQVPQGLQPMTVSSTLEWHQVTLPGTTDRHDLCSLPPRDEASIARILARQAAGFQSAACPAA